MGKSANQIATRYDAALLGGITQYTEPTKCIKKSELSSFSCKLISSPSKTYSDNSLVKYQDIEKYISKFKVVCRTVRNSNYIPTLLAASNSSELASGGVSVGYYSSTTGGVELSELLDMYGNAHISIWNFKNNKLVKTFSVTAYSNSSTHVSLGTFTQSSSGTTSSHATTITLNELYKKLDVSKLTIKNGYYVVYLSFTPSSTY